MTAPPVRPHDTSPFEAEVRAMLARRAADVSPSPARWAADEGVPVAVSGRSARAVGRKMLAGAAAATVLVAGAAAYAAGRDGGAPTTETAVAQGADTPIVWPLDDHVPTEVLAAPDMAAGAYLAEVVEGFDPSTLQPPVVDGSTASVGYALHGVHGEVTLRLDGDRWGMTAAMGDAVNVDRAYGADGDLVVDLGFGPAARSGMRVRVTAVTDDGAPANDLLALFEYVDGGEITLEPPAPRDEAAPPGREADQVVLLPMNPSLEHDQPMLALVLDDVDTRQLAAVRLDTLVDDDGDPATPDVVIGHATRAVEARPADASLDVRSRFSPT